MDENFDPNRTMDDSSFDRGCDWDNADHEDNESRSTPGGRWEAVAGVDSSLVATLEALEDGQVAIAGDIVAIRAGPDTYHPIKTLKVRLKTRSFHRK